MVFTQACCDRCRLEHAGTLSQENGISKEDSGARFLYVACKSGIVGPIVGSVFFD